MLPVFGHFLHLGVWPLIMGITMFVQMKLNPAPPDPTQKMIFDWMPLIFTFMLASFPAGLVIYWAWNNTLSVLQQSVIMKQARRQDRAVRQPQAHVRARRSRSSRRSRAADLRHPRGARQAVSGRAASKCRASTIRQAKSPGAPKTKSGTRLTSDSDSARGAGTPKRWPIRI